MDQKRKSNQNQPKHSSKVGLSRREQERIRRKKIKTKNNMYIIGGGIILAALLAIIVIIPNFSSWTNPKPVIVSTMTPPPNADFNQIGDPNAPIKIETFSDFNCSHCKDFNDDLEKRIIEQYVSAGNVHMTYISFPILAANSTTSAMAAYCAGDQGKFWEYKDTLYLNVGTTSNPFSNENLENYARRLDLNIADWRQCFNNNEHAQRIKDDLEYGKSIGVEGTPSFNVNGTVVYQTTLLSTVEQMLASMEQ